VCVCVGTCMRVCVNATQYAAYEYK